MKRVYVLDVEEGNFREWLALTISCYNSKGEEFRHAVRVPLRVLDSAATEGAAPGTVATGLRRLADWIDKNEATLT